MSTIAVLITCYNRKAQTMMCLDRLFSQLLHQSNTLSVYLVDDGCTDGTAETVASSYPAVHILRGSGSLFWNGGMRVAFAEAMRSDFDYYLWLNDDTHLYPKALGTLLAASERLQRGDRCAILVGSTCDPVRASWTYGGIRQQRSWRGVAFLPVQPQPDALQACDTMNGNCILIPRAIAKQVGNLDAAFRHGMGDLDYGFRARAKGLEIFTAAGYAGTCELNAARGTCWDRTASLSVRWHNLVSAKVLPPKEWLVFTRRHFGLLWPVYAVSPYLKTILGLGMRTHAFKDDCPTR
jgi:GT2 family glycosyltransferase